MDYLEKILTDLNISHIKLIDICSNDNLSGNSILSDDEFFWLLDVSRSLKAIENRLKSDNQEN